MSYVHRCMVVPAARVAVAKELVVALAGAEAEGMFAVGLAPGGSGQFTHYVSSGMISEQLAEALANPTLLSNMSNAAGHPIPEQAALALLNACDIANEEPFSAFARMSLGMKPDLPAAAAAATR